MNEHDVAHDATTASETDDLQVSDYADSHNQRDEATIAEEHVDSLHFKLLCPLSITGLIIGRGGSIINQLNNTCGAKIRLSQNHEYFPGTQDRVLLLKGDRGGITNALRELVTRIAEAPEKKNSPSYDAHGNLVMQTNRGPQGTFQIKVLIPKLASAAIIGKGGAVIKHMSEVSGARYQLGEEADPHNTKERIVAITSLSVNNLVLGAVTLMNQLFDEPRVRVYANLTTNYSGINNAAPHHPPPFTQAPHPMAMHKQQSGGQVFTPNMIQPQMMMANGLPLGYMMPPPFMPGPGPSTAFHPQENMNVLHRMPYGSQMQYQMMTSPNLPQLNHAPPMGAPYGVMPVPGPSHQYSPPGAPSGAPIISPYGHVPMNQFYQHEQQFYANAMRQHVPSSSAVTPQMFVQPNATARRVAMQQQQQQQFQPQQLQQQPSPSRLSSSGMYSPGGPMPNK